MTDREIKDEIRRRYAAFRAGYGVQGTMARVVMAPSMRALDPVIESSPLLARKVFEDLVQVGSWIFCLDDDPAEDGR